MRHGVGYRQPLGYVEASFGSGASSSGSDDDLPDEGIRTGDAPDGTGAGPATLAPGLPDSVAVRTPMSSTALRTPQAARFDVALTQRLSVWLVRVRYEQREGRHETVVTPGLIAPTQAAAQAYVRPLTLDGSGASHARSLEATAGFRTRGGTEGYASYVRASTTGPQNAFDSIEGLMRAPFVQAEQTGPLPVDVPHRVLAWGVFHLPSNLTVAPFLDARSGFPFTAIDDAWGVAGRPGAYRLPWMASLDLSVTRITRLPLGLPDARVGLKLYNIVSTGTEREVQRDLARADFGTRYDPVPRDFSVVCEFLWGRHHGA